MKFKYLQSWYRYNFAEGYRFDGHIHTDFYEINIILDGNMEIVIGDKIIEAPQNHIVVIEPCVFHRNRAVGGGAEMAVIQFYAEGGEEGGFFTRELDAAELGAFRLLLRELKEHVHMGFDAKVKSHENCDKLLGVLVGVVLEGENGTSAVRTHDADLYGDAVRYMEKYICGKVTISELAHALCISPSKLKKLFSDISGKGVLEYFTEMKVRRAERMLASGESVLYTSEKLGFSSQCYFTSVFKKITGKTPARAQKELLNIKK